MVTREVNPNSISIAEKMPEENLQPTLFKHFFFPGGGGAVCYVPHVSRPSRHIKFDLIFVKSHGSLRVFDGHTVNP